MSRRPMFHVKHGRPLLCRLGLHHWGPWDIRPEDWRIVERTCRRCHMRRIMIDKREALETFPPTSKQTARGVIGRFDQEIEPPGGEAE